MCRFLQEYSKQNLTLWGLTVENEPSMGYHRKHFNSLALNGSLERDFLKLDLGPALAKAGFKDLKVMIFDDLLFYSRDWFTDPLDFIREILLDKEASRYVFGVAFHWYTNWITIRQSLDLIHQEFPDYYLLSTEACIIYNNVSLGNWTSFELYAHDIIRVSFVIVCEMIDSTFNTFTGFESSHFGLD